MNRALFAIARSISAGGTTSSFVHPWLKTARPMKEVENSVVHVSVSRPQLVDVIAQVVGFRAPQFVSEFREPFDPNHALVSSLDLKVVHPFQER